MHCCVCQENVDGVHVLPCQHVCCTKCLHGFRLMYESESADVCPACDGCVAKSCDMTDGCKAGSENMDAIIAPMSADVEQCIDTVQSCDGKTVIVIKDADDSCVHTMAEQVCDNDDDDTTFQNVHCDEQTCDGLMNGNQNENTIGCDNKHCGLREMDQDVCDMMQNCNIASDDQDDNACDISSVCSGYKSDVHDSEKRNANVYEKPSCAVVGERVTCDLVTQGCEGAAPGCQDVQCVERPLPCDVCKYGRSQSHAELHCSVCSINYCSVCSQAHAAHTPFQSHAVVPVGPRCRLHQAEHLKYFCTGCTLPLCTVCVVTEHQRHAMLDLNAAAHSQRAQLQRLVPPLGQAVAKREASLAAINEAEAVRQAAVAKTEREIEEHTAELCKALQTRKRQLITTLHGANKQATAKLAAQRKVVTEELTNMKSLWQFAAKLLQPNQALQLLAMHSDVNAMLRAVETTTNVMPDKDILMFVPHQKLSVGELQSCQMPVGCSSMLALPSLTDTDIIAPIAPPMTTISMSGFTSPTAVDAAPLRTAAVAPPTWRSAKRRWQMERVGEKVGEVSEAYDVAVCDDGSVVVAEWLNQRLQLFDSGGYTRQVIGQGVVQPWGVTVTPSGSVVVTDERERTVKLFDVGGEMTGSWERGLFGWPRGLAVTPAGHYVVCDAQHGRHSVSVHLDDGACLHKLKQEFHWPRYVAVDDNGRIFVSDSSNHCVKVFSPDGRFLFRFGSQGTGPAQMCHPRGICVDPAGNLLLADQDNKRVKLYSGDGKVISQLLSFEQPVWGLALNRTGLMAVTQKKAISLYQLT